MSEEAKLLVAGYLIDDLRDFAAGVEILNWVQDFRPPQGERLGQ